MRVGMRFRVAIALLLLAFPAAGAAQTADPTAPGPAPAPAPDEPAPPSPTPPAPPAPPAPAPAETTQPPAAAAAPAAPGDESFDDAPLPRDAGGVLVPRDRGGERWRVVPRTAFYPLRGAWWLLWSVPRLGAWAYDRYQLKDRFRQIFFSDAETFGIFPVAFIETGFGLNAGVRVLVNEPFGYGEKVRLRASYGGRYRQLYSAKLSSGRLLGDRVELDLIGEYEVFPKSRFFGFGNEDLAECCTGMLIDPRTNSTAVSTRYRHDDTHLQLGVIGHLTDRLALRLSGELAFREFDPDAIAGSDQEIVDVYDPAALVGYEDGLSNLYGELELAYDSRRPTRFYLSVAAPSTGWHASVFAGLRRGLGDDPSDHLRWGVDIQRLFDLYQGDRVLLLRAYAEGVTGDIDEISFVDLPRLGGPLLLRGYDRDRFRDRNTTLVTAEYDYPIERNVGGYLFVDAGRVWRELEDFELDEWRIGFGGGLQLHTINGFLARVFLASSVDGGLFFNLSFDPVYDTRARQEAQ